MPVVVTGGAGYIGTNLCAALRADGHEVRVVDRRRPDTAVDLGASWVRADVRDPVAMRAALDGAELVYHLAAVISIVGPQGGLVESVNVGGVRVVAEAALDCGTPRFVHCSSVHAFDLAARVGRTVDESSPRATRPRLPAYDRSKAAGEVELSHSVHNGLNAVTVNPTGVLGAVDEVPSRISAVLLAIWRRRLPALVAGGFDWVDVRDVVTGLRAAAGRGRVGQSYLLPGSRRSVRELAALAAGVAGQRPLRRRAPAWSARAIAPAATLLVRRTNSALLPTGEALHALRTFPVVSGARAAAELGYRPTPIEDTLAGLYRYFVRTGRLTP